MNEIDRLKFQLERANRLIGWMMPYIGIMCPPQNGLADLNEHCCDNRVPMNQKGTYGPSLRQESALGRPSGIKMP